jgi:phage gp36-like protein
MVLTPKLVSATVTGDQLRLKLSCPLDTTQLIPLNYFKVNRGGVGILSGNYSPQLDEIVLTLSLSAGGLYVTYSPLDLLLGIRASVNSSAVDAEKRVAALKTIEDFPVERVAVVESASVALNYPSPGNPGGATVDDFIRAYTRKEAIELSNLTDGTAATIDSERIQMAIDDADAYIMNYIAQATGAGVRLITSNRRRTSLIIARYYLDSVRRRKDVTEDYERAIKELENSSSAIGGEINPETGRRTSLFRSHRTPQHYNDITKKNLDGWRIFTDAEDRFGQPPTHSL